VGTKIFNPKRTETRRKKGGKGNDFHLIEFRGGGGKGIGRGALGVDLNPTHVGGGVKKKKRGVSQRSSLFSALASA